MKGDPHRSRRDFLRLGAAGLAGVAGLTGAAHFTTSGCSPESKDESPGPRTIIHRTLGRTGLKLPVVSMGSCYAIDLARTALDEGIVYIHTSSGYGEQNHERLLGELFRDRPRDSFVIATSPDLPYRFSRDRGRSMDLGRGANPELVAESLEGSLQRLGLDHVDIYYLASVGSREVALHEPYLRAFEKLKTAGKTRFVGVATHENEPDVIRAASESGVWDVALTAYNFRQSHRDEIRTAIGEAAATGLGIVAMKTQAGVYWDRTRLRKINMKAALKWVLQDENVHTTIPAFSTYDELQEDLSIMSDLALTPQEERDLALGELLGLPGLYCQQCGSCRSQCPAGLDIPMLMRSHMYAFGHHRPEKAQRVLRSWQSSGTRQVTDIACRSCPRCEVRCSLGLDVRSRALEVMRVLETSRALLG